jgi:hypothetical protein
MLSELDMLASRSGLFARRCARRLTANSARTVARSRIYAKVQKATDALSSLDSIFALP